MLKVFLVEDEFVVREGIKNNIDWAQHGYEFCGEASDGELAYPMIQKLMPDIVITDIKMPFMDGLELSRLIKKELPQIEIIILSGYAEFDYAKEAINIGVAHYLTKPISGANLLEEIDKLAESIEEKRQERELHEKYLHEMMENTVEDRKKLFQNMVTGALSVTELIDMAGRLELDISAVCYNVVLVKFKSTNHDDDEEYSKSIVEVSRRLDDQIDSSSVLRFDRNIEGEALVIKADSMDELKQIQEEAINLICDIASEYPQIQYFGGIGRPVGRLRELSISFESASHAFAHRYMEDKSMFMDYQDVLSGQYVSEEEFSLSSIDPREVDQRKTMEFLKMGSREEVVYYIDEYFRKLGENTIKSNMFRQYIAMGMYFNVVYFVEEMGYSKDQIPGFSVADGDIQSVEGTTRYLVGILDKALELRDNSAKKKYSDVVELVLKYIEDHFGDEELSLNFLASYTNFSPNHLSMMFSQQTGMSFIKYLTDYRMSKAKELLKCTNKRSVDISEEVGYKDPHYFSYCFKKNTGMTPTQYRNGGRDNEETEE